MLHGKYEGRNRFRVATHATTDEAARDGDEVSHYAASEGLSSTQILALVAAERAGAARGRRPAAGAGCARGCSFADRGAALEAMHFGESAREAERGRERLAFEELLLHPARAARATRAPGRRGARDRARAGPAS